MAQKAQIIQRSMIIITKLPTKILDTKDTKDSKGTKNTFTSIAL